MTQHTNHEIVCIGRGGLSIIHTSGVDAASSVTYHGWTPSVPGATVKSFWLVPLARPGDYR